MTTVFLWRMNPTECDYYKCNTEKHVFCTGTTRNLSDVKVKTTYLLVSPSGENRSLPFYGLWRLIEPITKSAMSKEDSSKVYSKGTVQKRMKTQWRLACELIWENEGKLCLLNSCLKHYAKNLQPTILTAEDWTKIQKELEIEL
jgi:hypothetical protein